MKKLSEKELLGRAKTLYFDKNPNIEKIFVNEFGQFSYKNADLEEPNKHKEVDVYLITRKNVEKLKLDKPILDLEKAEDVVLMSRKLEEVNKVIKPVKKAEEKKEETLELDIDDKDKVPPKGSEPKK